MELLLLTQQCCDNEYNSQHIFEHNHSALMAETSHKNEIKSNVRYVLHPRNAFFYSINLLLQSLFSQVRVQLTFIDIAMNLNVHIWA